jgi:hypothetical protein
MIGQILLASDIPCGGGGGEEEGEAEKALEERILPIDMGRQRKPWRRGYCPSIWGGGEGPGGDDTAHR